VYVGNGNTIIGWDVNTLFAVTMRDGADKAGDAIGMHLSSMAIVMMFVMSSNDDNK
jgi:hypothetical protein